MDECERQPERALAVNRDGPAALAFIEAKQNDRRMYKEYYNALSGWAAADPAAEGVALAAEQLGLIAATPGLSGVTLVTPGDPGLVPAAIRAAGLRP